MIGKSNQSGCIKVSDWSRFNDWIWPNPPMSWICSRDVAVALFCSAIAGIAGCKANTNSRRITLASSYKHNVIEKKKNGKLT